MNAEMTDNEILRDEYRRLIHVEEQVAMIKTIARLVWSLAIVMIVQLGGGIYAFAKLQQQVAGIDLEQFQTDLSTALVVLADHGTELQDVRTEQTRLRQAVDDIWQYTRKQEQEIDEKTRERFYRSDGDRLSNRIERLENQVFLNIVKPQQRGSYE